jgi:(1->4)-alpha-D-glucan 1-alpha-D-glucosylmutase
MQVTSATYRLQFNPSFGFKQAETIIEYLAELGISVIYASPIFKAKKGSLHGYDITDPNQLNPELGSRSDFNHLMKNVKNHEMGWLQDIVPNHMAYNCENHMLMDVLENEKNSEYADFFDIRWDFTEDSLDGKILAPFLGASYRHALEEGEIVLEYEDGQIWACYYEKKFPIRLESYKEVLFRKFQQFKENQDIDNSILLEPTGLFKTLGNLESVDHAMVKRDCVPETKKRLWNLYKTNPTIEKYFNKNIASLNNKSKIQPLDKVLSRQFYKLAFWGECEKRINYRRFFYINDFIALKAENEKVLNHTHHLIFQFINEGLFTGLRIDHIDGLYDPANYLEKIRRKTGDVYIVVEKILALDEKLHDDWPVQGTTGYDFLNFLNGIFCKSGTEAEFTQLYHKIAGSHTFYDDLLYKKKKLIIEKYFFGDLNYLLYLLQKIIGKSNLGKVSTIPRLRNILVEILAHLPVYRTYKNRSIENKNETSYIRDAIAKAEENVSSYQEEYNIIAKILLKPNINTKNDKRKLTSDFVSKFQQFSSSVMAKGFEDTFLYNYNRFISLNEVGGDPTKFGITIDQFHNYNKQRASKWPHSMNATSTHDTKRAEDVRARLNVLSEIPQQWCSKVIKWMKINRHHKRKANSKYAPDKNDEYFLYQTLVGAFPFSENETESFKQRLKNYIIKAVREAKAHSTWIDPNIEYEDACSNFIEQILNSSQKNEFLKDFLPFQKEIAHFGIFNSLSQSLIKITSPGIPDIYQGCELWNFSLVDPDNRRPVNYERRKKLLNEIRTKSSKDLPGLLNELLETKEDGRIKLFLTWKALSVRKGLLALFQKGSYQPLEVQGSLKDQVIAFARRYKNQYAITVTARFLTEVISVNQLPIGQELWADTALVFDFKSTDGIKNCITEKALIAKNKIYLADALADFPVCLLSNS